MNYYQRIGMYKKFEESTEIQEARSSAAKAIIAYEESCILSKQIGKDNPLLKTVLEELRKFELLFHKDRFFKNIVTNDYVYISPDYIAKIDYTSSPTCYIAVIKVPSENCEYKQLIRGDNPQDTIVNFMYALITFDHKCNTNCWEWKKPE